MKQVWNEISIEEIEGFRIGNAEYPEAGTGCTVILAEPAALTGAEIRGGAPASRETALLHPLTANEAVNAVLLSGGSAYGLDAAGGVMQYLEENGIGFPTENGVVPIVCASCLFDLAVGNPKVRPGAALGYSACQNAGNFREGNHGAGTGAACGKLFGMKHASKSGLGAFALQYGDLKIGAITAANPAGNIVNWKTGTVIAGIQTDGVLEQDSEAAFASCFDKPFDMFHKNTTLACILTNAKLSKAHLCKVAAMAHDGFARAICPVHTMYDGDSIYVMSTCSVESDVNLVGALAARVIAEALLRSAETAASAYGLPGRSDGALH